jgi:hypothetical protein
MHAYGIMPLRSICWCMNTSIGVSGVPVLANYKRYKWNFASIEADIRHAMAIEVYKHIHTAGSNTVLYGVYRWS